MQSCGCRPPGELHALTQTIRQLKLLTWPISPPRKTRPSHPMQQSTQKEPIPWHPLLTATHLVAVSAPRWRSCLRSLCCFSTLAQQRHETCTRCAVGDFSLCRRCFYHLFLAGKPVYGIHPLCSRSCVGKRINRKTRQQWHNNLNTLRHEQVHLCWWSDNRVDDLIIETAVLIDAILMLIDGILKSKIITKEVTQCSSPPREIVLDPIGELSTRFNGHFCGFCN